VSAEAKAAADEIMEDGNEFSGAHGPSKDSCNDMFGILFAEQIIAGSMLCQTLQWGTDGGQIRHI